VNPKLEEFLFRACTVLLGAAIAAMVLLFMESARADTPPPVLTISAVIDNTYVAQVGEAAARMRVDTILNNVVIIYRDQVPLQAIVTSVEIRAVRGDNRAIEKNRKRPKKDNSAVTLFFTDKELTIGSTEVYGYANIGSLCTRDAIAVISLTTDEIDLMVIAHEMAHIFGVPHDGVDECETTPPTGFLMQAVGFDGSTFSQCSLDIMRAAIRDAPCLTASPIPPSPLQKAGGGAVDWTILFVLAIFAFYMWARGRL